jgi:hypothetical protein
MRLLQFLPFESPLKQTTISVQTSRSFLYLSILSRELTSAMSPQWDTSLGPLSSFIHSKNVFFHPAADQLRIHSINIERTPEPFVSARFAPFLLKGDAKVSFWVNQRKRESKIFTPRSAVCKQSACDPGRSKPT